MRFLAYFFIIACGVSLSCFGADQKQNQANDPEWLVQLKKPGAFLTFLNPFATFQSSIISSGHVQYCGSVDELNNEQKKDLLRFVTQLKYVRLGGFMIELFAAFFGRSGRFAATSFALLNCIYLFELKNFETKLN
jgi:hypothetical protein